MDNVDYQQWCDYAIKLLKVNGIDKGTLVDIGCGTGTGTELFAESGYEMIGIDMSQEMLEIAENKKDGRKIIYVLQDATKMNLPYKVSAMVSIGDSMNYITDYSDFVKVLKRVHQYLDDDGVFVFDLKTRKYFSNIGESTIAEDREECSFIWDNYFDTETNINEYYLSVFIRSDDGRYDKYEEEHYQRGYRLQEVKDAIKESGLSLISIKEAFTDNEGCENNDRVYVVVGKI
jgi:ubiquinone/menaquinone biosynthesis C-methylase UbiE